LNKIFLVLFVVSFLVLFSSQQAYATTFFVNLDGVNIAFDPDTLTIAPGDRVIWADNPIVLSMDLVSLSEPPLFSPVTFLSSTFEFTFNDEGVFPFRVHPTGLPFPLFDFMDVTVTNDIDGDGVPNDQDVCPEFDDTIDTDGDGIPDGCDPIPNLSCGQFTIEQNFMCVIDSIVAAITLAGNVLVTGNLQVIGDLTGQTIADLETRVGSLETLFLNPGSSCSGTAACIPGYVTANIDGDTLKVYGKSIRFALVDAPESGEMGFQAASDFIANACPVGALAVVDEDDMQTGGSFGRIIAVVYCNGVNANEAILDAGLAALATGFCGSSEFGSSTWAQNHGCP